MLLVAVGSKLLGGAGASFVGGLGLPRWVLGYLQEAPRQASSLDELPNAIDVIVRGIKSGLPLGDCLRIVASEAREPLKREFRAHHRGADASA